MSALRRIKVTWVANNATLCGREETNSCTTVSYAFYFIKNARPFSKTGFIEV